MYWIKGKGRIAIFPAAQYTGAGEECRVQVIIIFTSDEQTRWAIFFSDEQTRWALFFQLSKPDEHLFSGEQTSWALFFSVEHYSLDEQGEMSTFLSDEQVKLSTLYFQMSAFSLWVEHQTCPVSTTPHCAHCSGVKPQCLNSRKPFGIVHPPVLQFPLKDYFLPHFWKRSAKKRAKPRNFIGYLKSMVAF